MGKELDHRFYVAESDHRLLWNRNLDDTRLEVAARSQMWHPQHQPNQHQHPPTPAVDLLDPFFSLEPSNMTTTKSDPAMLHDDFWGDSLASPTETGETGEVADLTSHNNDLLDVPATDHSAIAPSLQVEQPPSVVPDSSTQSVLLLDFQTQDESSAKADTEPKSDLLWFQQP